jgi:hypothetical protein
MKTISILFCYLSVIVCVSLYFGTTDAGDAPPDDGKQNELNDPTTTLPQTLGNAMFPNTGREYAAMCEPHLGVPPAFEMSDGVTIPTTVDGVEQALPVPNHGCDGPSLQSGICQPGSTIMRFTGRTRDGVELPEVVWAVFSRNEGGFGSPHVSLGIQMIGYNMETGATGFFKGAPYITSLDASDPDNYPAKGFVPSSDDPAFDDFFFPPKGFQCVECHQNDPFVHNPYIDAARLPSNPKEPVLPRIATKSRIMEFDLPYYVIGAPHWDMRTIHIEGNKCLNCHRIGMRTLEDFIDDGWNPNNHMPPKNPGSLRGDFEQLLDCWDNGPENTPGCDWIVPPAGDAMGRVVGDDYPYKNKFNQPNKNLIEWYREQIKTGTLGQAPEAIRQSVKQFDPSIPDLPETDKTDDHKEIAEIIEYLDKEKDLRGKKTSSTAI